MDFTTVKSWTQTGLVTYDLLFRSHAPKSRTVIS
jgi:hypothetical protein